MITCYFGTPGCGKTSFLAWYAKKYQKKMKRGKCPYDSIYSNVPIKGCKQITVNDLAKFRVPNALILLDEITLDVDSRDYKSFSQGLKEFFLLHRHDFIDIVYCCQDYSSVDKKIRDCTFDLWYVSRSVVPFFKNFSSAKCIYRNININEYSSELTLGYRFSHFLEKIFAKSKKIIRLRPLWCLFDSHDLLQLADRPVFVSDDWRFDVS